MILFRIAYSIAIFAVFIIFRQSMDINLYIALLYSGVAVLCILLLDLLLGGIKSYRIISSLLISSNLFFASCIPSFSFIILY